jgi:hypothetical protein
VATSTFLLVVFAQAVGSTVGSEDGFREREYMAVLAQTVRLALDFERIVVAEAANPRQRIPQIHSAFKPASVILTTSVTHDSNFVF